MKKIIKSTLIITFVMIFVIFPLQLNAEGDGNYEIKYPGPIIKPPYKGNIALSSGPLNSIYGDSADFGEYVISTNGEESSVEFSDIVTSYIATDENSNNVIDDGEIITITYEFTNNSDIDYKLGVFDLNDEFSITNSTLKCSTATCSELGNFNKGATVSLTAQVEASELGLLPNFEYIIQNDKSAYWVTDTNLYPDYDASILKEVN